MWVKKATGLGITELILRVMLWLCVRDNRYKNGQMCIITGPRIEIALGLILRMKRILERANIYIKNRETQLQLNDVTIAAFPSNNLEAYRGLTSPKFIFLDEGDFFRESNIRDVRDTTERYIAKSRPYIVMVSTPNKPDLLFQQIEEEPEQTCMYHRLFFNYEWGLGKMFTQDEIELQRASPGFDREYDLKYAGKIGNVFSIHDIDRAIALGEQYQHLPINQFTLHMGGIDPGFSKITPLYIGEFDKENQVVRIIYYEGFDTKATPQEIADRMHDLHTNVFNFINMWWFIDGSNRGLINQIKTKFREREDWESNKELSTQSNKIIPVNFKDHKQMLEQTHLLVSGGHVAIPKRYDRLITSLRTAQATEWNLDKESTVNDDDFDSLRCLLKPIKLGAKA